MSPPPDAPSRSSGCQECDELQREFAKNPGGTPVRRRGLVIALVAGGSAVALSALCLPFLTPALRRACLPFVPATNRQVENVMEALASSSPPPPSSAATRSLVDIGSGDGRIVLAAAKNNFLAHGIELNYWLILYSRISAWRAGLSSQTSFARQDLWKANLAAYDDIVIFGGGDMMADLETKIERDLANSAKDHRVVACRFPFPGWKAISTVGTGIDTVWLYYPKKL